jgi:hypothetical protein
MTPWWCQAQERLRHRSEERRKKVRPTTAWRIGSHVRASDSDRLKEHITHACSCLVICILNYIIYYIILLYYYYIILYYIFVKLYHIYFSIILTWLLYYILYIFLFYTILYIYILIILFYSTLYYFFVMVWYFIIFFKKLLYVYNDVYDNKHFLHIMHMPVRVHVSSTFPVLNWHNRTTVPKSRAPLLVISISVSLCFICLLLEPPQPSKCCLLRCTKWAPHPINFWIIRHD